MHISATIGHEKVEIMKAIDRGNDMTASTLTIRLDDSLKEGAARVVEYYGLDLSTVTRAFLTQIVNTNTIPLSFDYEQPNEESLEAIRETEQMIRTGKGRSFTNAHDLIEAALNE